MNDLNHTWRDQWTFARRYNFNHGSLGATPQSVLLKQEALNRKINEGREEFIREGGFKLIDQARCNLARFVGADDNNLVLTSNITDSINAVIKSLRFEEAAEIIVTNHIYVNYPALLEECARRQGFKIIKVDIPYAIVDKSEVIEPMRAAISARTKLAIVDHISSPTAMIFPVQEIVDMLNEYGVDCFIDGAHAPGQIPLDLESLGAAYYGANNHKWLCAPLSSGFLYVRPDKQSEIVPAVGSGYAIAENSLIERFSWQGVIDFSPRIMISDTLEDMANFHPQGWSGIYKRNHDLAVSARALICDRMNIVPPVPDDMMGAMFTLPLGDIYFSAAEKNKSALHRGYDYMVEKYGFGVIFNEFGGDYLMRATCHLYNGLDEYNVLADALGAFVRDHKI